MTEHQEQNPIDELYRKTFESLPDTPAASGWDTPSERVWQNIQANMPKPRKGPGLRSLGLIAVLITALAGGIYWMSRPQAVKPAAVPLERPAEQPESAPNAPVSAPAEAAKETQTVTSPKPTAPAKPATRNSMEESKHKSSENTAQPLPGSKPTLPPNTLEAKKKNASGH